MRNWTRDRFDWMQQILEQPGFTDTARLLATVFATRFADAETGESYPSKATLAQAIGRTKPNAGDMVKIAIRELEAAGWLSVTRARGRGRSSTYRLAYPAGRAPEQRGNVVPLSEARARRKRGNEEGRKGGTHSSPILEPSMEPKARARGGNRSQAQSRREAPPPRPRGPAIPEEFITCPKRIAAWNDWLAPNRWPTLAAMGLEELRAGEAGAWVPFGYPPTQRQPEEAAKAEAFFTLKAGRERRPDHAETRGFG